MVLRNPENKKQLYVDIPADLVKAMDMRCRKTGRSRSAETILALERHLPSPIDGEIADLPKRGRRRVVLYAEVPAALVDGLKSRCHLSLRTLTIEVLLALERHLACPLEPLPPKPVKVKRSRGRPRKTPSAT